MGLQNKTKKILSPTTLREPFHILTITLLSLLLPLSFLLLARFSCAYYRLTLASYPPKDTSSFVSSFLLYTNPAILYVVVSIISIATLVHGITGEVTLLRDSSTGSIHRLHLPIAWIFLCTLQVCVGFGIEGCIAAGIYGYSFGVEKSLASRMICFIGLHETMLHWSRTVVKTVVDDTVSGADRHETWVQRVVMATSFGAFWWWILRDEVESLVVVVVVKTEMLMAVGLIDFIGWCLYYLTVTIGMVKIVKLLFRLGMTMLCTSIRGGNVSYPPTVCKQTDMGSLRSDNVGHDISTRYDNSIV
ncbi:hypothetical protein CFOL_v3_27068 [Cephalotus follicularis]|uniref:Transmembrane protein n=1 Tax=Cephalotus follicularis TaxID=3775 RepID=A0A1Q3CTY6_CEPFO|nr:hypothetical protein CFOL_v3_27068 [Cephalotus follicularis]